MTTKTIPTGKTPKIQIVNIDGSLSVVGWEAEELLIKADEDELHLKQDGDRIELSCDGDLVLRVPSLAAIQVGSVSGDMSLRSVTGKVEMGEIGSDLSMRKIHSVSIEMVKGDLSLRGALGSLVVKKVVGDASVRGAAGDVTLEAVADDLALKDVGGNIRANVSEDAVLYITPRAGHEYNVTAGDDILLILPDDADAAVTLQGDDITMDWPGIDSVEEATIREVQLGGGSAKIVLNAGGNVRLTNRLDAGDSADEFGNFAGLNFEWSTFDEKLNRQIERTTRKAEKTARAAARRLERNFTRQARRWTVDLNPDHPFTNVPSEQEPISDEVRMAILRMLQEKKISAAEADQLLNALEGDGNGKQ